MITLWLLGVTLIVMFVGWFSVTMWTGSSQRRQLAAAADQAAQAGATALDVDGVPQQRRPPARPGAGRAAGAGQPRRPGHRRPAHRLRDRRHRGRGRRGPRGRGRRRAAAHLRRRRRPDPSPRHRSRLPPRRQPHDPPQSPPPWSLLPCRCRGGLQRRRLRGPTTATAVTDADHRSRPTAPTTTEPPTTSTSATELPTTTEPPHHAADDSNTIAAGRLGGDPRGARPASSRAYAAPDLSRIGEYCAPGSDCATRLETQLGDAIAKGQHIEGQQPFDVVEIVQASVGEPSDRRTGLATVLFIVAQTLRRRRGSSMPPATSIDELSLTTTKTRGRFTLAPGTRPALPWRVVLAEDLGPVS